MELSLYQINKDFENCLNECIDTETGEIKNEELIPALNNIQMALEEKAINTTYVLRKLENRSENIDKEIKRLKALKDRTDKTYDTLKQYLQDNIPQGQKIETDLMTISWRKSESVEIEDLSKIPEKYKKTEVVITADKMAIKKAIKDGEKIEGAKINEKQNIQIK